MNPFGFATPMATPPRGNAQLRQTPPAKTIPFDYAFQFALQGKRGNKVQDVVEISTEGVFVALSIGYSLMLDEQKTSRTFQPVIKQTTTPHSPVLVPHFELEADDTDTTSLRETLVSLLLTGISGTEMALLHLAATSPNIETPVRIEEDGTRDVPLVGAAAESGSILRIWDKTHNLLSELFEVPSTPVIGPNPTDSKVPTAGESTVYVYGKPHDKVDVFLLENSTGKFRRVIPPNPDEEEPPPTHFKLLIIEKEKTIFRTRTGSVAVALRVRETEPDGQIIDKSLSVGDVLLVKSAENNQPDIPLSTFVIPRPRVASELTLAELEAGLEKIGADLTRGFRFNPDAASVVAADLPLAQLADGTRERLFEAVSVEAEEVSFLYSLDMGNTGREYQSKPIHNIAGLGIANGDRPMRPFAKPMVFEPRSFIRLQIEEISGPAGTLFIVLQGYKTLGTGRIPG
jgi:hypothetical protein